MKTFRKKFMAIVTMLTMAIVCSSCGSDVIKDIIGAEKYYYTIDYVDTSLKDAEGKQIGYYFASGEDNGRSFYAGEVTESQAKKGFKKQCESFESSLRTVLSETMKEGDYYATTLSLREAGATGPKIESKTIMIRK